MNLQKKWGLHKEKIQANFSQAATSYDRESEIQFKLGKRLISSLQTLPPYQDFIKEITEEETPCILDLGCGTGRLTHYLASTLTTEKATNEKKTKIMQEKKGTPPFLMYGLDLSPKMIEYAQVNHPHPYLNYHQESMEQMTEWYHTQAKSTPHFKKSSLIFSSSAIHWIQDFQDFFTQLQHIVNKKGLVVLSYYEQGCFKEIEDTHRKIADNVPSMILPFPSHKTIMGYIHQINNASNINSNDLKENSSPWQILINELDEDFIEYANFKAFRTHHKKMGTLSNANTTMHVLEQRKILHYWKEREKQNKTPLKLTLKLRRLILQKNES